MKQILVGIDLGGTNVKIGIFDTDLNLIAKTSIKTDAHMGPETVIENTAQAIESILAENNLATENIKTIGFGTPGPARYREGVIEKAANMPKFKNTPVRDLLIERMGKPVILENDANVACWGEFVAGAGKDTENMAFFTLGTGIGGGLINQGKLLRGAGDNAAELGHIIVFGDGRRCNCGQLGCAEAYASASQTANRAKEAVIAGRESSLKKVLEEKGDITSKDIYQHLVKGDELAKEITELTAKALAILVINILHTTEPMKFVFAGGMIAAGDILLDRIKYHFDQQIWSLKKENVEICFATLGEDAGIIGAAALDKLNY